MIVTLLETEGLTPEPGAPPPDRLISGAPAFETWSQYESADGRSFAGLWRATPGAWRIAYDEWEYCEILEGVSVITDQAGMARTYGPGDRFVIEPGFTGSWEVVETTTKRYVIRLP
jgi:uncharacterized cupin superfamily protein